MTISRILTSGREKYSPGSDFMQDRRKLTFGTKLTEITFITNILAGINVKTTSSHLLFEFSCTFVLFTPFVFRGYIIPGMDVNCSGVRCAMVSTYLSPRPLGEWWLRKWGISFQATSHTHQDINFLKNKMPSNRCDIWHWIKERIHQSCFYWSQGIIGWLKYI